MADQIEIRDCGEIRCNHLTVGQITWAAGVFSEFSGYWFPDHDPSDALIEGLIEEIESLTAENNDLEDQADGAKEEAREASTALTQLRDEVRAFLAAGSACSVSMDRLADALEASGG
ncbi:cell division protein ZapB [Phaeobacter sp. PT47_59]|uniref:cell division protein ZapB n=1 Tax=Phaeobacter sp. PT47_59 TaxID=3029979 RepID=UPI0023807A6A|nr:cell division protein ZapB [Phaeobacter sp. PT47_59]MDE4176382.1 cell division protein ZapB [Phaeobacter sp. PT47_59]